MRDLSQHLRTPCLSGGEAFLLQRTTLAGSDQIPVRGCPTIYKYVVLVSEVLTVRMTWNDHPHFVHQHKHPARSTFLLQLCSHQRQSTSMELFPTGLARSSWHHTWLEDAQCQGYQRGWPSAVGSSHLSTHNDDNNTVSFDSNTGFWQDCIALRTSFLLIDAPFFSRTWQMLVRCSVHAQCSAFLPSDPFASISILLAMPDKISSTLSSKTETLIR